MPTSLVAGQNGLPKVVIETPAGVAEVYLQGACLTRYFAKGREVIFVSKTSQFAKGKAIRGGVPICWPWFGPHPGSGVGGGGAGGGGDVKLPQHGFARSMEWTVSEMAEGRAVLELLPSDETRKVFPRQFRLRFIVTVGQDGLTMALETTNTDPIPFTFGDALHTYFTVPDVRSVRVTGLKDHRYRSKTEGGLVKTDIHDATPLEGETDRVYFDTYGPHEIITPNPADGRVRIHKSNSSDTVLWNPWETKAESLPDLAGGQWKGFVCVEAVNTAENSVTLAPGQSHTTVCRIEAL